MISRPTTQQLIDAMCVELDDKVAPAVTDPVVKIQLEMALAVLQTAAARSGSELAWMQEERDAIEQTARQLLDALPDAKPLQDALAGVHRRPDQQPLPRRRPGRLRPGERGAVVRHRGGATSRAIAEHIAAVGRLMDQRHANQQAVTGQFMAAGRT